MNPTKLAAAFSLGALALTGCQTAAHQTRSDAKPLTKLTPAPQTQAPKPETAQLPAASAHDSTFQTGVAAFRAGKFEDAKSAFEKVLRRQPDNVHAQYDLAL